MSLPHGAVPGWATVSVLFKYISFALDSVQWNRTKCSILEEIDHYEEH